MKKEWLLLLSAMASDSLEKSLILVVSGISLTSNGESFQNPKFLHLGIVSKRLKKKFSNGILSNKNDRLVILYGF